MRGANFSRRLAVIMVTRACGRQSMGRHNWVNVLWGQGPQCGRLLRSPFPPSSSAVGEAVQFSKVYLPQEALLVSAVSWQLNAIR
jgi:hypothetical protein